MTSIRRALTTRLLFSLAILALAAGTLLFLGIRAALIHQFDGTLIARLGALQSATRWDGAKIDVDFTPEAMPWYGEGAAAEYFEIRGGSAGRSSTEPVRSPSLNGSAWDTPFAVQSGVLNLILPDGRAGRAAVAAFRPLPDEELDVPGREEARRRAVDSAPMVSLAVAMGRDGLDETLQIVALGLVASAAAMAIGVAVAVRSSVARGLGPLDDLSARVSRIRADSLSTRLTDADLPGELRPIQDRLNELLEHLDEAFSREQRFTTAAAHELRTPVAELKSLLEVSLSRQRTTEQYRATHHEALDITLRSERLVATLLKVARGHARDTTASERASISPASILRQVAGRLAPVAESRGGRITLAIQSDAAVPGDFAALTSVFDNVLNNSVEYADPTPLVTCEVQNGARGSVIVTVRNPVKGLEQSDVARFFEPFWRHNQSRTQSAHIGMGLAIVRSLLEGMGGTIGITLEGASLAVQIVLGEQESASPSETGS